MKTVVIVDNSNNKWLKIDDAIFSFSHIKIIDLMPHTCQADDPDFSDQSGECPLSGSYEVEIGYESFYFTYRQWKELLESLGLNQLCS